ncbi:MAG: DUF2442 domain-containing protein [Verrucomicrobia bacterium]|nr:DUF2442 domain-containing protein [Verrucomicrobiota bacterium]MCH8514438.1 DUF2442 domain-containing protein [Kiritimatiellia bacterium]
MKYSNIGTNTSVSEVTDISPFGIWLLHLGKEYFLPYEEFPWFKDAPVWKVFSVVGESEDHVRWPELDVDLSLSSIRDPGGFPLLYEPRADYAEQGQTPGADNP